MHVSLTACMHIDTYTYMYELEACVPEHLIQDIMVSMWWHLL